MASDVDREIDDLQWFVDMAEELVSDARSRLWELEDRRRVYINVVFLGDSNFKKYSYEDKSRELHVGDLVKAGPSNTFAQVVDVGIDRPTYRTMYPVNKVDTPVLKLRSY